MSEPSAGRQLDSPGRRKARAVRVGTLTIGGEHPIVIQSMTVSNTLDTDAVVAEVKGLVESGCLLVRLTAPSLKEAENLREIRRRLEAEGIRVPMVADIHFTPNAALLAAEVVEKVRINPGNYADRKRFEVREYTDEAYSAELARVAERFRPLVKRLREHGAALRIGTNHGSLSDRIINRYGDTPRGMVESALEFARLCDELQYRELVFSMKSSVPGVMIAAYRLLARRMDELGMDYPIHLGVTEAGDGLEARVKSAIGIGALLADGLGDTIRVSLAEASVHEIPAAQAILAAVEQEGRSPDPAWWESHAGVSARRRSYPWVLGRLGLGGDFPVRVEARVLLRVGSTAAQTPSASEFTSSDEHGPEYLSLRPVMAPDARPSELIEALHRYRLSFAPDSPPPVLLEWSFLHQGEVHLLETALPFVDGLSLDLAGPADAQDGDRFRLLARLLLRAHKPVRFRLPATVSAPGAVAARIGALCRGDGLNMIGFLCAEGPLWIARTRDLALHLESSGDPIFLEVPPFGPLPALRAGSLLLDGVGDALCLASDLSSPLWPAGGRPWTEEPVANAWTILQACRLRLTRAEFIACPSCGRTQFDLQSVTERIRALTQHLKGVKIAIMGCIVNGPGEMADADFGYVGSGPGQVDLYVGKEKVRHGVPEAEAPARLVELIQSRGRWADR